MPDIQYVLTDELSEEVRQILFGWDADPFQSNTWGLTWRPKNHHMIVYQDGKPVAHAALVREIVQVSGAPIEVGGLAEVVTVPGFRGEGLAHRTIGKVVAVFTEQWHLRHGLGFCFPPLLRFYERLGWTRRIEPVWVDQPGGKVALPKGVHTMVQAWGGASWPPGEMEVNGQPW